MREHFICSAMKKPLPFVLGGGQERFSRLLLWSRNFPRRALLKINFIFVALRYVNV